VSAFHACDGGNQRGQFKPEFLCSEVDKLLAQLQNNLTPLKYSIDLNRIDVLRESLLKLGNLGRAILDSYDEFMRQLDRIATDIQTDNRAVAMATPQLQQFEALIFDMDGVLIDSEPLHERAKREALSEAGIIVPESLFASYTGRSDRAMIYEVAAGHGLNEQRSAEILDRKHRIYESLEYTLRPVSGAIEFVHWAKSRYRLALATSATSRNRKATLKSLQIESMFEVAVDSACFSNPKPSPEVFQIALERLALAPTACLVIEDAMNGIVAARAVGCFSAGLTTSFSEASLREAGADIVVGSYSELRALLTARETRE
jgi:HAD superfamily hydrolase (TIGR01509 family)